MPITAPFRFARINRWVYFPDPDWAAQVSHDLPFADGYCGEIEFTLTTKTPLLLGGARKKGTPGEVWPFFGPEDRYAIPGSSIQGMIRSILEVASFGKLGPVVSERRFGVRDLTPRSETANELYKKRITGGNGNATGTAISSLARTGWLIKTAAGVAIVPCDVSRIHCNDILAIVKGVAGDTFDGILHQSSTAKQRYDGFFVARAKNDLSELEHHFQIDPEIAHPHNRTRRRDGQEEHYVQYIKYSRCISDASGGGKGTIIFTGKATNGYGEGAKKREFVFFNPARPGAKACLPKAITVPPEVWQDFLLIHDQNAQPNPNWEFWKHEFEAGNPVPVFYLGDHQSVTAMGTAQMFKLAMAFTTHDLLGNSFKDHLNREKFDLPSLIFGATGEEGGKDSWYAHNLKRRASFDMARLEGEMQSAEPPNGPSVLLSPKPNYYPIYVRQAARVNDQLEHRQPYAAYADTEGNAPETRQPELSGVKIWPNSGASDIKTHHDDMLMAVSNKLNPLRAGTTFKCTLRVHNLREVELGALLWAMTFGEEAAFGDNGTAFRHRIGAGKPFGLGEVELRIGPMKLARNDGGVPKAGPQLVNDFANHMREQPQLGEWKNSAQVRALCEAAKVKSYTGANKLGYLDGYQGYARERSDKSIFPDFLKDEKGVVELQRKKPIAGGGQEQSAELQARATPIAENALEKGHYYKNGPQQGKLVYIHPTRPVVTLERADGTRVEVGRVGLVRID